MNILITGANGGLGIAIARKFLESSDNHVFLGVRSSRDAAEALVAEFPNTTELVSLDVTSPESWTTAIDTITADGGRLDVLVNNAGIHDDGLLATMSDDQWSRVIDSNLSGSFFGCRAVIRAMMANRFGRIINISSLSALLAPKGQTNYAAAKAGVVAMTQSLAKEIARAGITVNAICPGYVETAALDSIPEAERKALAATIPMRRFAKPSEIAAAVAFLASEDAAYITGSTLKIDGGIF